MDNQVVVQEKRGVLTLSNAQRFGVGAVVGAALITNANAAVDVAAPVATLTTDGTAAITAVGAALLGLAGVAVVFKWVKAAFFS
ncbi:MULTISPECIES: major capsid protein [Acinetobacter]|uniref:major capsid protein n=1 Tax=Acinetobacter TaxID=469 RepID=UPI002956F619|nr:major capsid protein [Acinetobacter baumannii]